MKRILEVEGDRLLVMTGSGQIEHVKKPACLDIKYFVEVCNKGGTIYIDSAQHIIVLEGNKPAITAEPLHSLSTEEEMQSAIELVKSGLEPSKTLYDSSGNEFTLMIMDEDMLQLKSKTSEMLIPSCLSSRKTLELTQKIIK